MTAPFKALAAAMLEHQLGRGGDIRNAFDSLAPLACLDHILAADASQALPIVLTAFQATVDAASCRLLLRMPDGGYVRVRQDGSPGAETPLSVLGGMAAAVLDDGVARASDQEADATMPATDWNGARPPGSLLCAALPDRRGVLQGFTSGRGGFDAADLAVADLCCAVLAPLLEARAEAAVLIRADDAADAAGPRGILARILAVALRVLDADRGWILLHDAQAGVLRSTLAEGLGGFELQVSAHHGVAASALQSGTLVNVAEAYQDPRFNPALDRLLGYRTRSLLCAPIETANGRRLGVLEMLNRRGGPFTTADEENARALAAQVGVTLEHTELFEQLSRMKGANESMLRSLSNGVLMSSEADEVGFVNGAALNILRATEDQVLGRRLDRVFDELNGWVVDAMVEARATGAEKQMPGSEIYVAATDEWIPVNLSILPLRDARARPVGTMLVLEDLQREQDLRRTMARYVSNDLVERLMAGDPALLSGSIQDATTLFSDIRGFSGLSESLGAQGTVALLNQYFSYMEDVVANRSGLIDKYIGDAVMAVFGIPFAGSADADNAVQAATDMLAALAMLNAERVKANEPALRIGIGLATGPVLMGNIGSPKRMDFTVIGDPVNLASRLESATKQYGADILLDGVTLSKLVPGRVIRRIDVVRVLGQDQPTEVYEVLDHRLHQWGEGLDQALAEHAAGMTRYVLGDWSAAMDLFAATCLANPLDKAAALLRDRCSTFIDHPPADWDGVFNLTEK